MADRYFEQCGCGAQFVTSEVLNTTYNGFWSEVHKWRAEHRHEFPPVGQQNPISTTAKGEFGFTRYVPEWEDTTDD